MNIQPIHNLLNVKRITKKRLQDALDQSGCSEIRLWDGPNSKGTYNKHQGIAASFRGGYRSWRTIAEEMSLKHM